MQTDVLCDSFLDKLFVVTNVDLKSKYNTDHKSDSFTLSSISKRKLQKSSITSSVDRFTDLPTCSSVMEMVGKLLILSLSAGGGPEFSNWFSNYK